MRYTNDKNMHKKKSALPSRQNYIHFIVFVLTEFRFCFLYEKEICLDAYFEIKGDGVIK